MAQVINIDFAAIADSLLFDSLALLREWFPAGKLVGKEYLIGNLQGAPGESLSINTHTGKWSDFSSGESGGDLISLYAAIHGIKQSEAAKHLSNGHDTTPQTTKLNGSSAAKPKEQSAPKPKEPDDTYLYGKTCAQFPAHPKHGKPVKTWEYKTPGGDTIGYVCRFEPENLPKQFSPYTCWKDKDGKEKWKWKKWQGLSFPYKADEINNNPEKNILIAEGEKSADAAQKLLPDNWIATCWSGGASAVKRTDWNLLKNRPCYMWPDADVPGITAANALKEILPKLSIVELPAGLPEGWDLADAPADFDVLACLPQLTKKTSKEIDLKLIEWKHVNSGKPLATIENLSLLLTTCNYACHYNMVSKRNEITVPGETFSMDNMEPASLACVYSRMKEVLMPVDGYVDYLLNIGEKNKYNPVMTWVESKKWDGISRLQSLYDTIESPETEAKELLIRRWMITALSLIYKDGVDSAGCLVLQGATNLGKTWWARKLLDTGNREELFRSMAGFDPHDRDNLSQLIRFWIVELGDIGSTFRKADIDALKNFITDTKDILRRPYGRGDQVYARRTAIIASVDQDIYLNDTAGNRRFWTIPCTAINSYHNINMQQVWAEVLELIRGGEGWKLEPDELAHIMRINQEYQQIDPVEEKILEKYRWDEFEHVSEWKSATQIAEDLGLKHISPRETRMITSVMLKRNGGEKKRSGAGRYLKVPALRGY